MSTTLPGSIFNEGIGPVMRGPSSSHCAAMAADVLVTLANGTSPQSVAAAFMAFRSMPGLICDPITNHVEVPCPGENVPARCRGSCAAPSWAGSPSPRRLKPSKPGWRGSRLPGVGRRAVIARDEISGLQVI